MKLETSHIKVCQIVCMTPQGVIGVEGRLPWHIPEDLKRFKAITMGSALIMGRKTWQSLPGILPGRPHVVVSNAVREKHEKIKGVHWTRGVDEALAKAQSLTKTSQVFVIGGGQIYRLFLPFTERISVTEVHMDVSGDTIFPIECLEKYDLIQKQKVCLKVVSNNSEDTSKNFKIIGYYKEFQRKDA